jgi:hypothetical protein
MMRKLAMVVGVFSLALSEMGCSAVMALSGRPTPDLGAIRVGSTRAEVERRFGRPISSAIDDDGRSTTFYEYERGNDPDAGRAMLNIVNDIATFGLWEPFATLGEALQGSVYHIAIVYDRDDHVIAVGEPAAGRAPKADNKGELERHAAGPGPVPPAAMSTKDEVVATSLEHYASLLQELHNDALAAIMSARAEKLRDALGEKRGSVYLGFNPTQLLQQYAALLRGLGREGEATEIQELADWRERAQIEQFIRSQGRRQ